MDAQKLKQANDLSNQITRLEIYQRRNSEPLDQAVLSILSTAAMNQVRTIIDADLVDQLAEARQRFAAL